MHELSESGIECVSLPATVLLQRVHSGSDSTAEGVCWEYTLVFKGVGLEHVKVILAKVGDIDFFDFTFFVFLCDRFRRTNEVLQQSSCFIGVLSRGERHTQVELEPLCNGALEGRLRIKKFHCFLPLACEGKVNEGLSVKDNLVLIIEAFVVASSSVVPCSVEFILHRRRHRSAG